MPKTIMTVDDSASIRLLVGGALRQAGYSVLEAKDGVDAADQLSKKTCDMVLTDLNMPNLDGIGLIKKLRTMPAYRFIPIIMLTTESQPGMKQKGKDAGATGWIVKPFKPAQLLAVISRVLR